MNGESKHGYGHTTLTLLKKSIIFAAYEMSPDILKGKESGCFLCPIFYVLGAKGKELRRHGKSCYPFLSFCPTYTFVILSEVEICPSKKRYHFYQGYFAQP